MDTSSYQWSSGSTGILFYQFAFSIRHGLLVRHARQRGQSYSGIQQHSQDGAMGRAIFSRRNIAYLFHVAPASFKHSLLDRLLAATYRANAPAWESGIADICMFHEALAM